MIHEQLASRADLGDRSLLLLVVPVYAQETTPAVEPTPAAATTADEQPLAGVAEQSGAETATGLPVLVLLRRLGAIGAGRRSHAAARELQTTASRIKTYCKTFDCRVGAGLSPAPT